ncbi:MAG: hypothetical protein ABF991_00685 [Liquorilactobacillus hordei]|uniref:hypothetical protein n=1 Tax=Liquorilactobacillus hordei TaxID=468911 RepID=UPI0039EB0B41
MSRSTFPNNVDTFTELSDLPANKIQDANEFVQLKGLSSLDNNQQNRLNALAAELQDNIITPETMNKITDSMVALETFFLNNVDGYIEAKQQLWATYVNNFNLVGVWDSTKKYGKQNLVSYNGDLYLVLQDVVASKNDAPDVSSSYHKVAYKGDKGDIGLNAIYKGVWSGSTSYAIGDAVSIKVGDSWNPVDMVFICKVANSNQKPDLDAAGNYWFPYTQIVVGKTQPSNLSPSTAFIQVLD